MLGGRKMIAAEVEQVIAQGKGRVVVVVFGRDGAAVYRVFAAQFAQLGYDDLGAPPLRNQKFADSLRWREIPPTHEKSTIYSNNL
jgi:hypothetical protein